MEYQMDERKPRVAIHYQNVIVDGCRRPLRVSDSGTWVRGTSFFARVSRQTYLSLSINSTRSNDFHGGPESSPRVARYSSIYNLISSIERQAGTKILKFRARSWGNNRNITKKDSV